jgi:NADH:ubiquinone oxidoreductase subunit 5 (subunit L)/multisubunit Na+/H+ antiporter MnhA subunit
MIYPLVLLAIGSVASGWIGLPAAFGGSLFEGWLEPVFGKSHEAHGTKSLEELLMIASVVAAAIGFYLAYLIYHRRSLESGLFSALAGGLPYRLFYNKYYVDEIYEAIFVRGTLLLARMGAWIDRVIIDGIVDGSAKTTTLTSRLNGWIDNHFVDGVVNGVANSVYAAGGRVRMIQTGSINGYLYVVLGAVLAVMILRLAYG